jgi:starch synthase
MGNEHLKKEIEGEIKPSRYKKVIRYDEAWKEDVTGLLDVYKSLTAS